MRGGAASRLRAQEGYGSTPGGHKVILVTLWRGAWDVVRGGLRLGDSSASLGMTRLELVLRGEYEERVGYGENLEGEREGEKVWTDGWVELGDASAAP